VEGESQQAFAVWITGLPSSGKSTLAAALKSQITARGVDVAVLESDALREILTPSPQYDEQERDTFYTQMAYIGSLLVKHGVPVIFDATANRRTYRDRVRQQLPRFLEVYVDTPLETCMARDPKGIYRQAVNNPTAAVPGLQTVYEPPEAAEVVVRGNSERSEAAAQRIISQLIEKHYL